MKEKLSLFERISVRVLDAAWGAYAGYSTIYLEELCRTYGLSAMTKLLGEMGKATDVLAKQHGDVAAQTIVGMAGTWNGCRFCGAGHLLAANLLYYRETSELFPIDERDVLAMEMMTFEQLRSWLAERLDSQPRTRPVGRLVDRLLDLQMGDARVANDDDAMLKRALDLWTITNMCSTTVTFDLDVDVVPALATVGKDKKLLKRYRAARAEHETQ
ncbi:MAG: hypothetical protein K8H88_22785 [Sandaracinaceae bacterium]|nr:hypothetical protein [Sandaracinaceae bacterium]